MSDFAHLQRFKSADAHGTPIGHIIGFHAKTRAIGRDGYGQRPKILLFDHIADLKQDWLRLQTEPHVMVHQSYAWCKAWSYHHRDPTLFIALKSGAQIEMILPLELVKTPLGTYAQMIGTTHSNGNFPLASSAFLQACPPDFMAWLTQELRTMRLPFDGISLDRMRPTFRHQKNVFLGSSQVQNQNASFQLNLLGDFDSSLAQISAKKRRKEHRKTHNKLQRLGGYSCHKATSPGQIDQALDAFFRLKSARFETLGIVDAFAEHSVQEHFRALAHLGADETGHLELHYIQMNAGKFKDQILAVVATTVKDGHMICHFNAFDENIGRDNNSSPGIFLFYLLIKQACENGLSLFDMGIGDQRYKRSITNLETAHFDCVISLNWHGWILSVLLRTKTWLKRIAKSNHVSLVATRRLKHWLTRSR